MPESQTSVLLIALVMAAWASAGAWALLAGRRMMRQARAARSQSGRLTRLLDEAPALPLIVRRDGRIDGPARMAGWLGLDRLPDTLGELSAGEHGLTDDDLARLQGHVLEAQRAARPFAMSARPRGAAGVLGFRGHLADPTISPGGAALVWIFDFSDSSAEVERLSGEAAASRAAFGALSGLIEAAPIPMWFRGPDLKLKLVNSAYLRAVGASSAEAVIEAGTELIEPSDGVSAAQIAGQARDAGHAIERNVTATIGGQRQTLRISDLPVGEEGIAGYAFNIEEVEELSRQLRRFREAQRAVLDTLSAGIAQFDIDRSLVFANQHFQRMTGLGPSTLLESLPFERVLDRIRETGRLPEVRDFPEWRRERLSWFLGNASEEESWLLADGTHLRVVAHPMPEGGLLLIMEDRTEQLQLSSARDTLLRTRAAMFDNLSESLGVFTPDGRLALWNRKFAADWSLDETFLGAHPRVAQLLERFGTRLLDPAQASLIEGIIQSATLQREQRRGRLAMADGRHLELAGVPLPDGNGLLTALDVTGSHRAAEALRERNAALIEADEIKTRFIANMSYEFRTPLTSISGFAELLESGVAGELSDQAKDYLGAILASVDRLSEQIETVLDLSQSEAGNLPLARERIDLYALLVQVIQARSDAIEEADLTLDFRGDPATGRILGDGSRLARALGHLLDSAIYATPPFGRIDVELYRGPRGNLVIVIAYRGPSKARPPGAPSAPEPVIEGADPGLALARQLIEAHGGALSLQEGRGQGMRITITLP